MLKYKESSRIKPFDLGKIRRWGDFFTGSATFPLTNNPMYIIMSTELELLQLTKEEFRYVINRN